MVAYFASMYPIEYCLDVHGHLVCFKMNDLVGNSVCNQLRPFIQESTGSRPISEVKLVMATSVLSSEMGREYVVP